MQGLGLGVWGLRVFKHASGLGFGVDTPLFDLRSYFSMFSQLWSWCTKGSAENHKVGCMYHQGKGTAGGIWMNKADLDSYYSAKQKGLAWMDVEDKEGPLRSLKIVCW